MAVAPPPRWLRRPARNAPDAAAIAAAALPPERAATPPAPAAAPPAPLRPGPVASGASPRAPPVPRPRTRAGAPSALPPVYGCPPFITTARAPIRQSPPAAARIAGGQSTLTPLTPP